MTARLAAGPDGAPAGPRAVASGQASRAVGHASNPQGRTRGAGRRLGLLDVTGGIRPTAPDRRHLRHRARCAVLSQPPLEEPADEPQEVSRAPFSCRFQNAVSK